MLATSGWSAGSGVLYKLFPFNNGDCSASKTGAARRYGGEHKAPELQKEAVYGLTELNREAVRSARLVANPGCYPTSVQLPLSPLLQVCEPCAATMP